MQSCKLKRKSRQYSHANTRSLPSNFRRLVQENARKLNNTIEFKPFEEIGCKEELYLRTVDLDAHQSFAVTVDELFKERVVVGSLLNACNHICVTGSVGVGKTTLLRHFIEKAQQGNISSFDPDEDIVHWINWKTCDASKRCTISQFLFSDAAFEKLTEPELQTAYEWALRNSTRLIFILDDLDSALTDLYRVPIGPYDVSTPRNIILNLLEGTLFVGCSVLSTCDERKYECLTEGDDKVDVLTRILLCGFHQKSVNRIASKFLGEVSYRQSFVHFKNTSPYVMALCENPTNLIMALTGLIEEEGARHLPKGMCGIVVNFLVRMTRSNRHIIAILNKLKEAAFQAKRRFTTFLSSDCLKDVGLLDEDIKKVSTFETFRLFCEKDDGLFKFANPVMQDMLSALHIAESDWDEFQSAMSSIEENDDWSCITRYTFGIILDDGVFQKTLELLEPESSRVTMVTNNRGKKCKLLRGSVVEAISSIEYEFEAWKQFSALHIIAEVGKELKELVFQHFNQFSLGRFGCLALKSADICALAICICFTVNFDRLSMTDCCLPANLLDFLHETIMVINCSTKIKSFHFDLLDCGVGRRPTETDIVALSRFLIHVAEHFNLNGWSIGKYEEDCLQEMLDKIQAFNLKVFINQHDVLTAQSRWCDIAQEIIPKAGGSIQLNDCGLDFSKGSLTEKSKVIVEMKNCERDFPDDYIVLSPSMHVGIDADLLKAVLVSMKAWCILNEGKWKSGSVGGEVLHLDDDSDIWKPTKAVDLTKTNNVQFKCKAFSTIVLAIKVFLAPMFAFPMTAIICAKGNIWGIAFCLDHKSTVKEAEEELQRESYRKLCPLVNSIYARIGSTVEIRLDVSEPAGFYLDINAEDWPKFKLTKKFIRHPRFRLNTFFLKQNSKRRGKCKVSAKYETLLNDVKIPDGGGVFECDVSGLETERVERLEDIFHKIVDRFANIHEFSKFAMSKDGFSIDMNKMTEIKQDHPQVYQQQLEMLKVWKSKQGEKATPQKLHQVVNAYFDKVPDANKTEQLQLNEEFDKAISEFKTYNDWTGFALLGLDLEQEYIDDVIGEQQNITKEQKKEMLRKWKEDQGNKATVKNFQQIVSNFTG